MYKNNGAYSSIFSSSETSHFPRAYKSGDIFAYPQEESTRVKIADQVRFELFLQMMKTFVWYAQLLRETHKNRS